METSVTAARSAFICSPDVPSEVSVPPFICSEKGDHRPFNPDKRGQLKEWFYHAVRQGCLPCVRHCIEILCIDPEVESDHQRYTALAWSQWAVQHKVSGARAVFDYLRNRPFVRRGHHTRWDPYREHYVVTIIERGPRVANDFTTCRE